MTEEIKTNLPAVVAKQEFLAPIISVDEAVEKFAQYQELKKRITAPDDIQKIQGRDFLKKSYWRKLEKLFGVSLELLKEWHEDEDDRSRTYYATYKAIAPNGQFCVGDGACNTHEKEYANSYHNTRGTAHTRSKNRGISDLVGGGEVSAEEINDHEPRKETAKSKQSRLITEPQRKRLYAIAKKAEYSDTAIKAHLKTEYGFTGTADVTSDVYEQVCEDFENKKALQGEEQ